MQQASGRTTKCQSWFLCGCMWVYTGMHAFMLAYILTSTILHASSVAKSRCMVTNCRMLGAWRQGARLTVQCYSGQGNANPMQAYMLSA